MNPLILFALFFESSFLLKFSLLESLVNICLSIINPVLTLIEVLLLIGGIWITLVLIITIAPLLVAIIWVPQIYDSVFCLGIYHKLKQYSCENQIYISGESFREKILKVFKANVLVIFTLYLALFYIFNSFQSATIIPFCANQSLTDSTVGLHPQNDPIFLPILLSIPTLLLTLRILANPTCNWISDSPKFPGLLSSLGYNNFSKLTKPSSLIVIKIRHFKDQICSFYFSFIIGTLVLFYFSLIFTIYSGLKIDANELFAAMTPKMDIISIVFFVVAEIILIVITTIAGELYLKKYEPIDQI